MLGEIGMGTNSPRVCCITHIARLKLALRAAAATDAMGEHKQKNCIEADVETDHSKILSIDPRS